MPTTLGNIRILKKWNNFFHQLLKQLIGVTRQWWESWSSQCYIDWNWRHEKDSPQMWLISKILFQKYVLIYS